MLRLAFQIINIYSSRLKRISYTEDQTILITLYGKNKLDILIEIWLNEDISAVYKDFVFDTKDIVKLQNFIKLNL